MGKGGGKKRTKEQAEKSAARLKKWRKENPEKVQRVNKEWREKNPQYQGEYYAEHADE